MQRVICGNKWLLILILQEISMCLNFKISHFSDWVTWFLLVIMYPDNIKNKRKSRTWHCRELGRAGHLPSQLPRRYRSLPVIHSITYKE